MTYAGDLALEQNLDLFFTTVNTSGVPTTLSGTPEIAVYEANGTTEITSSETLTVDFDGRTGLNHLRIAATAANGYEAGKDYSVIIISGTVGGSSVVGYVVGSFSVENRRFLTAAQVNSEVDTALADIHLDHLIATAASIPAVTSGTFLDQIMDDGTATYDRTTDSLQAIRDRGNAAWEGEAGPTEADIWSYATRTVDLTSVTALLGTPADTDLATDIANLPTATDTATAVLGTTLTISAPSDGSAPTLAQALSLLMGALGVFKLTRSGTTLTAYANDETTVLATWTIDSASAPTSRTRAS